MMDSEIREALLRASELHRALDYDAAIAIYRSILAETPGQADALTLLASALRSQGHIEEAVALYDRVAETNPSRAEFWFNRGNALGDVGRFEDAIASYRHSLALDGENASVFANLAIAEAKTGDVDASLGHYRDALRIDPQHKIAAHNLGNVLAERGQSEEAAALLRQTVRNWPDLAEAHYNLGLVLLRLGDYANGFKEYEWRWDTADFFKKPGYRQVPVWNGQPLKGRKLIVHGEQGLGDTIQFAKVLGLVRSICDNVVFHVPVRLERLLKSLPFDIQVTGAHGATDADFQIPLLSLMHKLKLTVGSVPGETSFLSADPERAADWRRRLALGTGHKTIGLVWQGNPNSPAERGRSLASAELLKPLSEIAGVRLIALQQLPDEALEAGDTASGWRVKGLSFTLEHPGPETDTGDDAFVDTAAIMAGLDLVVSVCTGPLHLAGALGVPTIALLRTVPDWRWMMDRADTPWYPAMQLVRQRVDEPDYQLAILRAVEVARSRLAIS
jgi:tetratricopeptide (TPR) repeat protein